MVDRPTNLHRGGPMLRSQRRLVGRGEHAGFGPPFIQAAMRLTGLCLSLMDVAQRLIKSVQLGIDRRLFR